MTRVTKIGRDGVGRGALEKCSVVPPTALLSGHHSRVHGTLRASVCQENEQICRSVKLEL